MVPFRRLSQKARRSFEQHRDPLEWHDERDKHIMTATFPIHPLPSMQAPFEESMLDATGETGHVPFVNPKKGVKTRQQLLCRDEGASELSWNFTYNCHWRNNPKGKFHPLVKTVTQIVFGLHLLHQHLEKSVADVADILLKHVNELDSFLQRANEDLESSLKDMLFRHKCLKVPMEHVNEFDRLLEDRAYRAQLLDGNVVIERTIGRMSGMLNDYLIDINTFQDANQKLDLYLLEIGDAWAYHNEDVGRIYSAMCGNTGGWSQFLQSLVAKAEKLGVVLVQVSSYCNEIEKRCGAAGRRSMIATRTSSRNSSNSRDNGRGFRNIANNKPLPTPPSERPPFMVSQNNGTESPSDVEIPQRHSQIPKPKPQALPDLVNMSDSAAGTPKRSEDSASTSATSNTDVDVRRQTVSKQPEYHHEAWHSDDQQGRAAPPVDSGRTSRLFGHRRNPSSVSKQSGGEALSTPQRLSTKPDSPPLTGKDSAYSSVSGASGMSPTVASPRSASSVSSRQTAQFGLFPSRNLTPKGSVSGRLGAMSPTFGPTSRSAKPVETPTVSRPTTSISNYSDASSSKRLSKRSSFSSLKRLFTKKRSGEIETIAE
ncbi:Nn.00g052140.m01.CDS01 [Neocucurbitaria sp. VM-36]